MGTKSQGLEARARQVLIGNYKQAPLAMVRGQGCELWDADGRRYLDLYAGIATCSLGHCHPDVVAALEKQAHTLWHIANGFFIEPQIELAERLTRVSGMPRAFFCNSGGEANEAKVKATRKYFKTNGQPERHEIICFDQSFHGRTLAMVAATGQPKYQQGFEPLPPGFLHAPWNDLAAVEALISARTAAIWVEPVQGEGGVRLPAPGFLQGLQALCRKHGLLFLLDEVQTGMGRTGSWFAFQREGLKPDVVSFAKAVGNGIPLGGILATEAVAAALTPGSHGSTFGGNPLATAVGCAVVDVMERDGLIERSRTLGEHIQKRARELLKPLGERVVEVRGHGLLIGIELTVEAAKVSARARERGVLFNAGAERVIRLAPAFVMSEAQVEEALSVLAWAIAEVSSPGTA